MATHASKRLSELSQVLWREREDLEMVVFKLEEQRLLLEGRSARWLCRASQELDAVLDELAAIELNRAVASAAAAAELGISESSSLRTLAGVAPAPWPSVFNRHFRALVRLVEEIIDLADNNRELLEAGLAEVQRTMGGRHQASTRMLVDAAAYSAALATNDRVLQPSLVDAVVG
ncbi:MAG TPA: flagellar export chaperone FlgN [Acidimicrobiales bacterium]|nr:flagellar export chaperone FlgN [Acidimicrobiales bacterium]